MTCTAKMFVGLLSVHWSAGSCATEDGGPSSVRYHFCIAKVDSWLTLLAEACKCVQLLLQS